MSKVSWAKLLSKKNVFKYGTALTAGAAFGGSFGAAAYGGPGERESSAGAAAIQAAGVVAAGTAAVMGRKHIAKFIRGGLREVAGFRRIRGRIVPIFKKPVVK